MIQVSAYLLELQLLESTVAIEIKEQLEIQEILYSNMKSSHL